MLRTRPRSPCVDPAPCWSPQTPAPSPAKRRRLHQEPACPEPLAQPELEAPASSALTSVVFLAAGSALQLPLDGIDLLLEPEPTSVLQVSLQGHTILLVPEGLQDSTHFGQPVLQDQVPEPSTGAERYSPRSIWELDSYLLGPFPGSPLQPLPPSPSQSPQEQLPPRPPCSPRAPCKARKRLVYE
ncbi:proline-rich protein 23A3-like [Mus caroli]|uniref:Proline-rich protein 23A3-like n=1 Tax=Mus caroli TaxID=10089 RepID=A0A6P5QF07_MUSCR|nr:proline-rich protein 23A3-like [Mus caroli]